MIKQTRVMMIAKECNYLNVNVLIVLIVLIGFDVFTNQKCL